MNYDIYAIITGFAVTLAGVAVSYGAILQKQKDLAKSVSEIREDFCDFKKMILEVLLKRDDRKM